MKTHFQWLYAALGLELRAAHAGSSLGSAWLFLAPTLQVCMYVFLFQIVWRLRVNIGTDSSVSFVWFLISAYLPIWAFQEALVRATAGLLGNAHIIRNTLFPPWILIVAKGLLPYLILLAICLPFWSVLNALNIFHIEYFDMLILFYVVLCQAFFTIGLAMLLASVGILIRDLSNVMGPLLMGLVLTAPVLYPIDNIPEEFRYLFWLNPLTMFAEAYHRLLLTTSGISYLLAISMFVSACVALIMGISAYRKISSELPDLL